MLRNASALLHPRRLVRTLATDAPQQPPTAAPAPPGPMQHGFPGYTACPPALTFEFSREYLEYADRHMHGGSVMSIVKNAQQLEASSNGVYVEVAFGGRSNVGKSSLINAMLRKDALVTTSKTPGCTRTLAFLRTPALPRLAMVDMPGYGYAQVSKKSRDSFNKLVGHYLTTRRQLRRTFVLIDSRVGLKKIDEDFMSMLDEFAQPYQLLLTKIDKISTPQLRAVAQELYEATKKGHPACYPVTLAASAHMGWGLSEVRAAVVDAAGLRPEGIEDPAGINFDEFAVPGDGQPDARPGPIRAPRRGPFEPEAPPRPAAAPEA